MVRQGPWAMDAHIEDLVATYNDEGRLSLQDSCLS
jgi:hypothetical protein